MLAAVAAVAFWGAWFPLSRLSVTEAVTPADLALLRAGIPALVLLPVVLRHGLKAGRAGWWGTAALAGTVGVPFCFTLGTALEMAPAGHAAILIPGVFPALIVLLGALLLGERVGRRRLAGLVFAMFGVCMVGIAVLPDAPDAVLPAYGLMHLAAWMWAIYTVAVRLADIPALHALAIANVASTVLFLPPLMLLGDSRLPGIGIAELGRQVLVHGIAGGLVSVLLYSHAVRVLGASRAGIFAAAVPPLAALFAVPMLGEGLGPLEWAGLTSVTAGILAMQFGAARRP